MSTLKYLLQKDTFTVQELALYPSKEERILATENEQQDFFTLQWSDINGRFQLSLM